MKREKRWPGATITATHVPTGSVYKAVSREGGLFNLNNMNPGGPYTVEISYVNFPTDRRTEVFLNLGEAYSINSTAFHKGYRTFCGNRFWRSKKLRIWR